VGVRENVAREGRRSSAAADRRGERGPVEHDAMKRAGYGPLVVVTEKQAV
jgi:hypothetical protein